MKYSLKYIHCFGNLQDLEGWEEETNDPNDAGGRTKFGLSQLGFPDEDISNLTLDRAMFLIHRDYWTPWRLETINDQDYAFQLLESAFHMDPPKSGKGRSVRIAQGALLLHKVRVQFDGIMGPQTVQAINTYPHKISLLKWMNVLQGVALLVGKQGEDQMIKIIKERIHQLQNYGRGWGRRISL